MPYFRASSIKCAVSMALAHASAPRRLRLTSASNSCGRIEIAESVSLTADDGGWSHEGGVEFVNELAARLRARPAPEAA